MDKKFLKIVIAAFIVLAVIALFPWIEGRISSSKKDTQKNISVDLSGFTKDSVDKVVIKKMEEENVLQKKEGKWQIGQDEADEAKIDQLFEDFAEMKVVEAAAQNEANHAKFEVTKETGYQLIISQGGKDTVFYVGKADNGGAGFYIRKEGIKNVYLMEGHLRDDLALAADKWKKATEQKEASPVK
jgi:hypothetical protein